MWKYDSDCLKQEIVKSLNKYGDKLSIKGSNCA